MSKSTGLAGKLAWPLVLSALLILFILQGANGNWEIYATVVVVGILSFFGILSYVHHWQRDSRLNKAEMRKAIAGSLILVYFYVISLVLFTDKLIVDSDSAAATKLVENYAWVIVAVVAFYFGGRSIEETIKTWTEKDKPPTDDS